MMRHQKIKHSSRDIGTFYSTYEAFAVVCGIGISCSVELRPGYCIHLEIEHDIKRCDCLLN